MKFPSTFLSLFILVLIAFSFSNCSKDETDPPAVRTVEDVEADFQNIDISAGIHDETLRSITGTNWDFRVIAPDALPGVKYPLVIDLHGASGGSPTAHMNTECYVEPAFENKDVFIISPNGSTYLWNHFRNQEMVINLLIMARTFWPIDPDKIVVIGYSNGGNGAWFFGETQPGLFSAAIPMASSYTTVHPNGSIRVMPIPMYVIHGEDDELFPVDETTEWVNLTKDEGSEIEYVIAPGLGHYEPCSYVPYLKDAVTWLEDTIWN